MGCQCIPGHTRLSTDGPVLHTTIDRPPAGPGHRLGLRACTGAISIQIYYSTKRPECKSRNYRAFAAGQYPVPSTHVTQYYPTFGAPVRLPCSKSPSRGRLMSITVLHGTPPRRGLRALHAKTGLHTRLIDLLRFPLPGFLVIGHWSLVISIGHFNRPNGGVVPGQTALRSGLYVW
jgi:hypothetical protein